MTPTNRIFTDVETGYKCRLYTSQDNSKYHLIYEGQPDKIADGSQVNGFYICAHAGVTIKTSLNKQIKLDTGQFYHLNEKEQITHKKYTDFTKFTKI